MKRYTVGVDFGTLSARALLLDADTGEEIAAETMAYPHGVMSETLAATGAELPPDYALQDPADYIAALTHVVPAVLRAGGIDADAVVGIGIDFTTCTLLSVDADGTPLCSLPAFRETPLAYAFLWKHHAAHDYAVRMTEVAQERGEAFLARCGGKVDEEWAFPKICQVLFEAPAVYHTAHLFVEAGDWIVWQLTGRLSRGYQFAAYKSHYDAVQGYPSEEYFAAVDERLTHVVRDKLGGALHEMGTRAGTLNADFAARLSLKEGIAVAVAMPDGHSVAAGLGLSHAGDMLAVLGTSGCFMALGERNADVPGICGSVKDGILPGFHGFEAGLCCLGEHFAYAADRMVSPAYVEEATARGISVLSLLMEKAEKRRAGESGVLALGWFNGNRSTLVDAKLSGAFVGLTLQTAPEDLMRALCEATAFGARNIIENYERHGVPIRRIVASGGIAHKNPFLMQLYADVLGREITVTVTAEAPARSSAIAAASAAGLYDGIRAATEALHAPAARIYLPNGENTAIYDRLYALYHRLHDYLGVEARDVMHTLRDIAAEQKGV